MWRDGMTRKKNQDEKGAATVEFAIVAVLLFSLIFGIIEFGVLMYDKHVLTNASREGARAGVVMQIPRLTEADIRTVVDKYAKAHMVTFGSSNDPITNVTWEDDPPNGTSFGTDLEVNVTYSFDFLFLSMFGLGPIPLSAETHMRME
jgi:Flp pilus assembly protein TadG